MQGECFYRIWDMISLIEYAHAGQKYGDEIYEYHLYQVKDKALDLYKDSDNNFLDKLAVVALGHDLLEDTWVTYDHLLKEFGEEIANAILSITKEKEESYEKYLDKVRSNSLAYKIKIADILCNLNESVKVNHTKRINKYATALNYLIEKGEIK